MTQDNRVEMLKGIIGQVRDLKEKKKAVNEEIKSIENEMYSGIVEGDRSLEELKTDYSKTLNKVKERKDHNAKIKRLTGAMEKIIMSEAEYDDCQMTIDDIMKGAGEGVEIEVDEDEDDGEQA